MSDSIMIYKAILMFRTYSWIWSVLCPKLITNDL